MLHAVIMAGGSGTRFWPLSRTETPKQLLHLAGERTMIQQAFDRSLGLVDADQAWVITNERQLEKTQSQLPEIPSENFLAEPMARNTAPCIGLVAIHLLARDPDAEMLVMPADHVIGTVAQFAEAVRLAQRQIAGDPELLTLFGIVPNFPSTGFGYIERGAKLADDCEAYRVASFREKPDHETATDYLRRGTFFWNCGIFVWKAETILAAIREFEPEIAARLDAIATAIGSSNYDAVLAKQFPACPAISIDYAVLERAKKIAVIEALFEWDDVGSWQALHRLLGEDQQGNTVIGKHLGIDTSGCIVRSSNEHMIATLGVTNCIVVHTPDATLVADKSDENAIKQLISELKTRGFEHLL